MFYSLESLAPKAEGAIVIQTWAPPRHDFRELESLAPATPTWPEG